MTELAFQSATAIATLIRDRKLSAEECLAYFRKRIERFNPQLNAVIVFDWERAQTRARAADAALARGDEVGPLHGVPMTVKESFDYQGHPTTWGDPDLRNNIAKEDDLIVRRLEAAGAVVFGKTNVPYRLLDFQSYNEIYGTTNNPWDLTRGPGGSSGGGAAAVAAGLVGLEVGSDIGGSIRNPAHYCGIFGHKSTYRLVGATRAAPPGRLTTNDLSVAGPLARSADDLALALSILAGPGPLDTPNWRPVLAQPTKSLKELRIAIWPSDSRVAVANEISARVEEVGHELSKLGVKISDHARPSFDVEQATRVYRELLEAATNPLTELNHSAWRDLDNERARIRLKWREFFKDWDFVIAPISATPAFPHDHSAYRGRRLRVDDTLVPYFQQIFWAGLVTLGYLPSTVFPTGLSKDGLPIGLQVFADNSDDLLTIDFARQFERELGGFEPPPKFA